MSGLPGIADIGEGEFGTRSGVHVVVYRSSDSPAGQAVAGASDVASATIVGALRAAIANPPARMSPDAVILCVAISCYSLVC